MSDPNSKVTMMEDHVLHVHNTLGKNSMVGKVLADDPPLFFHEGTPTQWFRKYASPGGVDAAVVSYCLENDVEHYYHVIRANGSIKDIYHASMSVVAQSPRGRFDNRDRFFPEAERMEKVKTLPFTDRWVGTEEWLA